MKALIITPNYPSQKTPQNGSFVHQLLIEWGKIGLEPLVINPQSIPNFLRSFKNKKKNLNPFNFNVKRPLYVTFGTGYFSRLNLKIFKSLSFYLSIKMVKKDLDEVSFLYGKFLLTGGYAVARLKKKHSLPAFVDIGESTLFESLDQNELEFAKSFIKQIDGFICVSHKLKHELLELGAKEEDILLSPNGVNLDKFKILDKAECREKIGLLESDFVIIFVGNFIERKGPNRIIEALNLLNLKIEILFIGQGPINVECKYTFFKGTVLNEELPRYLNCADLFVLPTLAEGNCNAINEAKACGLPILSSDIPEIKEQVSTNEGILVNPLSIEEIADGINFFYNNPLLREKIKKNLIGERNNLSLQSRAQKIDNWIKKKLNNEC
ncbi:glycosyltransferase [Cyclobacteriaceae bacterium YHN15]|nr:glycosyltransferase [Cyclobacteriaceae bacterium YHN15]